MQANEPAAYLVNISDGLILHFDQQLLSSGRLLLNSNCNFRYMHN